MPDAEYQRKWREKHPTYRREHKKRQSDIKAGKIAADVKTPFDRAAYMREYRKLSKDPEPVEVDNTLDDVVSRGKILSLMMSTPPSMWRPEWTADLD
jgi:hypothetical protein